MNYTSISKFIRPFLFFVLGVFFLWKAPELNMDHDKLYRIFGLILILYAAYRVFQSMGSNSSKCISALFIIGTLAACSDNADQGKAKSVIYCDKDLEELMMTETEVFEKLYPKQEIKLEFAELSMSLLEEDQSIKGFISESMDTQLISKIERERKLTLDSLGFVRLKYPDSKMNRLIKIFEFEPENGPVKAFASFLCGPRGQLIAVKEGYMPVYPPEREVDIKRK